MGLKNIYGVGTGFESTGAIIGWGMDVAGYRVSPSKTFDMLSQDFSFIGLGATILGLLVGIFFARYYADKEDLHNSWR